MVAMSGITFELDTPHRRMMGSIPVGGRNVLQGIWGQTVSVTCGAPRFQLDWVLKFQGRSSSTRLFGWPAAMASRVVLSQA